jgi:hypothetical protein
MRPCFTGAFEGDSTNSRKKGFLQLLGPLSTSLGRRSTGASVWASWYLFLKIVLVTLSHNAVLWVVNPVAGRGVTARKGSHTEIAICRRFAVLDSQGRQELCAFAVINARIHAAEAGA